MTDGLSLLELSDLPATWRAVIRLLMREQPMSYGALATAAADLPEAQRLEGAQLDEALLELRRLGYVIQEQGDGEQHYRPQIARKTGRQMSRTLWNALDSSDDGDSEPPSKPASPPSARPRKNLWDSLG